MYEISDDSASSLKFVSAKYSLLDLGKYNFIISHSIMGLLSGIGFRVVDDKLFISYDNPANISKIKEALAHLNIPEDAYTVS